MSEMKTEHKKLDKERIVWLLLFMAIFTASFSVGSEVELQQEESEQIKEQISEKIANADSNTIFLNNIVLGLVMFIPALGIIFGIGSGFATGLAFASFNLDIPAFAVLWLTPFGLMELVAYSIAMSRSLLLIKRRKFLRQDKKIILIEVGIVIALLFLGGVVESIMIGL